MSDFFWTADNVLPNLIPTAFCCISAQVTRFLVISCGAVGYFQASVPLCVLLPLPGLPFSLQKTLKHLCRLSSNFTSSAKPSSSPKQHGTILHLSTLYTTRCPYIPFYICLFKSQGHIVSSSLLCSDLTLCTIAQFFTPTRPSTNAYWVHKYIFPPSHGLLEGYSVHKSQCLSFPYSRKRGVFKFLIIIFLERLSSLHKEIFVNPRPIPAASLTHHLWSWNKWIISIWFSGISSSMCYRLPASPICSHDSSSGKQPCAFGPAIHFHLCLQGYACPIYCTAVTLRNSKAFRAFYFSLALKGAFS